MSQGARFSGSQLITALALVVFSITLMVGDLLDPTRGNVGDSRLDVADVGLHPRAFLASTVLLLVSTIALLLATAGLWRMGRSRRPRLSGVGAFLLAVGALGHAALVTFNAFLAATPGGNPDEMAAMLDRVNEGTALLLIFPMLLALAAGLIIVTLALWRGGIAPLWCFIAACVMFLGDFFGGAVPGATVAVYGLAVLTTARLALAVLRTPAALWARIESDAPRPAKDAAMSA